MSSERITDLEKRVSAIEQRNSVVESDKAWERSLLRRLSITISTYVVAALYMTNIGFADPLLSAAIPAGGYILSTLALGWLRRRYQSY